MSEADIKRCIQEYIQISGNLDAHNKQAKELRNSKKVLEEKIQNYMVDNSISKLGNGNINCPPPSIKLISLFNISSLK